MLQSLLLRTIVIYQRTLSRDHGPKAMFNPLGYCRYYPSCSEYARLAVLHHGFRQGMVLALQRVMRCHPWAEPRVDLPPRKIF